MSSRPAALVSTSIKSLPAEVLSEIFVLSCAVSEGFNAWCEVNLPEMNYSGVRAAVETLAWEDEGGRAEEPPPAKPARPNPYACLPLSLVCRHWRAVVLECGALWCNIIDASPSWASTLLARSKGRPLNVAWIFSQNPQILVDQVNACTIALQQLHRVRALRLSSRSPLKSKTDLASIVASASYAPLLQDLHIFHHLHTSGVARTWVCPRLETYEGHCGKGLPWMQPLPFPVHSSLTRFVWCPAAYIDSIKPTSQELYIVLRQLPLLEHLQVNLSHWHSHRTPGAPLTDLVEGAKPIHLPRLRRLILDGSIQPCSEILDIIDFPAEVAHVTVSSPSSMGYVGYDGPSIWSFVPTFESDRHHERYLPPPRGYGTETFAVVEITLVDDCDNAVICGWRGVAPTLLGSGHDPEQPQQPAAPYTRSVELYVPTSFFEIYMRQLFAPFSMSHVQVLCLREPWVAWVEQWTTMLPVFTNVHTLCLDMLRVQTLVDAILRVEANDEGTLVQHHFPCLKRLRLSRMVFGDRDDSRFCPPIGTFDELLAKAFASHTPSGLFVLDSLAVARCPSLTRADLVRLRDQVGVVFWDGCSTENYLPPASRGMFYDVPGNIDDNWRLVPDLHDKLFTS